MRYLQKLAPIATDNTTVDGCVNNNMAMKKSKSWDMDLHYLRVKEVQDISEYAKKKDLQIVVSTLQNITLLFIINNNKKVCKG